MIQWDSVGNGNFQTIAAQNLPVCNGLKCRRS